MLDEPVSMLPGVDGTCDELGRRCCWGLLVAGLPRATHLGALVFECGRSRAEEVVSAELTRLAGRLPELDDTASAEQIRYGLEAVDITSVSMPLRGTISNENRNVESTDEHRFS